ncbi:stage III sporulation protein AB [Jeotgalibacillus campisalis]|uniref:Stage III sporulation protein AB n=1 Tax=Jeotgalibacillus campisalis TaxID=220754 RepID=A0A0C2R6T6_9BACL|nr:stage III sporulation protein AB [Jeotgalibacillus campisalis]KIL45955.1 hypothetical protein KR50_26300 [Jeotgalibacillus campisalis]
MTIHWIGALLFITGSSLEGFRRSNQLQKRQLALIEFAQALTWMQNEIVKRQTPILEIIQTQIQRKGEVGELFGFFQDQLTMNQSLLKEAWTKAVLAYKPTSNLSVEDLEWITRVGDAVQPYDRQSIEKELSFIIDMLRSRHQEARNLALQMGKVYKALGVMGGILIVLLLS